MSTRSSSLNNTTATAMAREIASKYDVVKAVSEALPDIELVAATDTESLIAAINEAKDFTGITVVAGETASWDAATKVLTVPTLQGVQGEQGIQGIQGEVGPTGARGAKGDAGPQGEQGIQGAPGQRGLQGIQGDKGDKGDTGPQGVKGDTGPVGPRGLTGADGEDGENGVSVHHLKATGTTDPEGDFGTFGELDTYTFYANADETLPLGYFVVRNGVTVDEVEGLGIMRRSTYDTDGTGIVDNSEALGGKSLAQIEAEQAAAIQTAKLALGTNYTVADNAARLALTELTVSDKVFVQDDGDGKWAQYWVIGVTDGQGSTSTFEVAMDEDTYLNANTAASIKATYESNADTNAFTDTEKAKVGYISVTQPVDLDVVEADTVLNNTHRNSTGSDHTFIDQDVTTTGTPSFNSVQLNGGTGDQGLVSWNVDEETLDLVTDGSTLQVGQEVVVNVRNTSGVLIPNGTPVMFTGTIGNSSRITVSAMDGSTASAESLVGIATVDIADAADGKAAYFGKVRGLDTTGASNGEVWTGGDILYIDPTNVGKLTKVKPSPGELLMAVAAVVHAHTSGSLMVRAIPVNENSISEAVVASFYSKSELDAGQLDNRYYTETEIDLMLSLQNEASEIVVTPIGNLASTTVQAALEELQTDVDTRAYKTQTSTTDTTYTDATTATAYKLYIDNGNIVMEEL